MTNRQALQRANVASFTLPGFAQDGFPHLRSASLAKIGGGMRLRGQVRQVGGHAGGCYLSRPLGRGLWRVAISCGIPSASTDQKTHSRWFLPTLGGFQTRFI